MKMVRTLKNEVLMRSSHKLKFKRRKCVRSIEQPFISLDLKYYMVQIKLGYLKSILQSRSSLLPSYCIMLASITEKGKFKKIDAFFKKKIDAFF